MFKNISKNAIVHFLFYEYNLCTVYLNFSWQIPMTNLLIKQAL